MSLPFAQIDSGSPIFGSQALGRRFPSTPANDRAFHSMIAALWNQIGVRLAWVALASLLPLRLSAAEIVVFAAASLSESLRDIGTAYEKEHGDRIKFNFGASNLLARQIEEGAPADIFFSADDLKMDALQKKGLLSEGTRRDRLGNSLVIVVAKGNEVTVSTVQDLAGPAVRRVALAEPASVPAGIYAKAYLTEKRLWEQVEKKVIPTENVRAALAAVESGNVDAGIVYKTDAAISKKVKVAVDVPASEGPRINYPVALLKESKQGEASRKFLNHLMGKESGEVFARYGFIVHDK